MPANWSVSKLHHIFRVRKGNKNTGMKESNLLSLSYGRIKRKDIETSDGLLPESFETYQIVEPGNIVMRLTDLQNDKRSLRQGLVMERGIVTSAYDALEVENDHDPRFWAYALLALDLAKYYYSLGAGVRQSIKFADFPNDWVASPDPRTQKNIANFLDREIARIDKLKEKRSNFANLILERRAAVVSRSITGTCDDKPWLSSIPNGWKADRAKIHFRESQRRSKTGEEELLTVSHITGVTKRSEKEVYMFMAESNEGYKLVAPRDLIINTMWAWMGAMGVSSEHGLISPSYGVYTPISNELRPAFVDLMVRSKPFVAEATRRSKGIHSSRLRLYPDAFLDMRLPIPPIEEQDNLLEEIDQRTRREDVLLEKNKDADALLQEFRSALITAAVTGQIDVKTWGKFGQTDRRLDQIEEELSLREARA